MRHLRGCRFPSSDRHYVNIFPSARFLAAHFGAPPLFHLIQCKGLLLFRCRLGMPQTGYPFFLHMQKKNRIPHASPVQTKHTFCVFCLKQATDGKSKVTCPTLLKSAGEVPLRNPRFLEASAHHNEKHDWSVSQRKPEPRIFLSRTPAARKAVPSLTPYDCRRPQKV